MPKVVVTRVTPGDYSSLNADVVVGPEEGFLDPRRLRDFLAEHAPFDALVSMFHDQVDDDLLDAAGRALRVVCNFAVGYENINVAACAKRDIVVCNTPDAVTEGTADLAWALLLGAARRLTEAGAYVRSPEYARRGPLGMDEFLGLSIAGKTLLIVGAGRIGRAVALRSIGWGMRVLYVARSRHLEMEFAPINAQHVGLDDGLIQADFVSLHTPSTSETKHLINARRLALMKDRAVLINTARGPIIEEAALVAALREKRIFAAGLDVYENEPNLAVGLSDLDNAILTPHIGSASETSRNLMANMVCANITAVLSGHTPPNVVG